VFAMGGPAAPIDTATPDLRFAFAVAAFADVLRDNPDAKDWSLSTIEELARSAATDKDRVELVSLIEARPRHA